MSAPRRALTVAAFAATTSAATHAAYADGWSGETEEASEADTGTAPWRAQENRVTVDVQVMPLLERAVRTDQSGVVQYSEETTVLHVSSTFSGQLRLNKRLFFDVELPLAMTFGGLNGSYMQSEPAPTSVALGSVVGGLHWSRSIGARSEVHAGGKVSMPTTLWNDEADTRVALAYSAVARGFTDMQRLGLGARGWAGVEVHVVPSVLYRGDAAVTAITPVANVEAMFVLETVHELEYRHDSGVGGGLRVQAAGTPYGGDDSFGAVAFAPFVGFEPAQRGFVGRVSTMIPVGPGGFSILGDPRVYAIHATLGGKW